MNRRTLTALFNAAVDSHLAEQQGWWTTSVRTSQLITVYAETAGVPYWWAQRAVMERVANILLDRFAQVTNGFLRSNSKAAAHCGEPTRANSRSAATVNTGILHIVECWNEYGCERAGGSVDTPRQRLAAFCAFAAEQTASVPNLFAAYTDATAAHVQQEIDEADRAAKGGAA